MYPYTATGPLPKLFENLIESSPEQANLLITAKHAPNQLQQLDLHGIGFVFRKILSRHSMRNSPGNSRPVSASMAAIMFSALAKPEIENWKHWLAFNRADFAKATKEVKAVHAKNHAARSLTPP